MRTGIKAPLILILLVVTLLAEKTKVDKITWNGAHFTYSLVIGSSLSPDDLFDLLASDSATLVLKGAADSVSIKTTGQNKREVTTIMNTFGHRLVTVTDKILFTSHRKITLDVLKFNHSWNAIPKVIKGGAVYIIHQNSTGSELIYLQDVSLDRMVNSLSKMLVSWQLMPFRKDMEKLIHKHEKEHGFD